MNKVTMAVAVALFTAPFIVPKAEAINHTYRAQLERSGCTQVTDGNGTCDIHKSKAENQRTASKPTLKNLGADAEYVMDMPISSAAEYLLSKGWKPNNGEWHKAGYIMRLVVEDDEVVNAQLTK